MHDRSPPATPVVEDALYQAALEPDRWTLVLEQIGSSVGALGGALTSVTNGRWYASQGLPEPTVRFLAGSWTARGPRLQRYLGRIADGGARFLTEADCYGPGELEVEPLYREYLWPRGLGHSAVLPLQINEDEVLVLCFERELASGAFPSHVLASLNGLAAHLQRAARVGWVLVRQDRRAALAAYSGMGIPAAAVTRDGRVLECNASAAAEGIFGPTLGAGFAADEGNLRRALHRLSDGRQSVPLADHAGRVRTVAHLLPLADPTPLSGMAAALVVLLRSQPERRIDASQIQRLFDLTPSEAAIAARIVAGETVDQIAVADSRSRLTVRNQLKSVLSKTGARRQLDLARLVTDLLLPSS